MDHTPTETKAKDYQRSHLRLEMIEQACTVLFLIAWVWIGPALAAALGEMNRYALLVIVSAVMYISYQAALFVLDYLGGYRLEHAYDLSTETLAAWLWRHTKMVILSGGLLGVLVIALYSAVWYLDYWYVWCWLGWLVLSVVFTQVFPVVILPLFYPAEKMDDQDLLGRLEHLSEGTGISVEGIYSLKLSQSTRKGNAMLAGLGRTRRVLLSDTLLEKLNGDEIEIVYAHELGHHVHRHFAKQLTLHGIGSLALFALLYLVLNKYAGSGGSYALAVGAVPMVALVISLFSVVFRPIANAFSRHFERRSDQYALDRTGSAEHFVQTFQILSEQNLADPSPPRWVVIFYYDHPPIHERIAAAKAWQQS